MPRGHFPDQQMDTIGGGVSTLSFRLLCMFRPHHSRQWVHHSTSFLPPAIQLFVFETQRVDGAPAFTLGEVRVQAARSSRKAETMKQVGEKERPLDMVRKAMAHGDIMTEYLERVEVLISHEGIPSGLTHTQPRRQRDQACRFQVSIDTDGTATVKIDEMDPFTVSPLLGRLALYLAAGNGDTGTKDEVDDFVPYKSVGEIVVYMKTSLHREFPKGRLNRQSIACASYWDSRTVAVCSQTHQQTGDYRIRLRREKFCALACVHSTPGSGLGGSGQQSATSAG